MAATSPIRTGRPSAGGAAAQAVPASFATFDQMARSVMGSPLAHALFERIGKALQAALTAQGLEPNPWPAPVGVTQGLEFSLQVVAEVRDPLQADVFDVFLALSLVQRMTDTVLKFTVEARPRNGLLCAQLAPLVVAWTHWPHDPALSVIYEDTLASLARYDQELRMVDIHHMATSMAVALTP